MLGCPAPDRRHLVDVVYGPRRVGGRDEQEELGGVGAVALELLRRHLEAVVDGRRDVYPGGPHHPHHLGIRHPVGGREQRLVARVEQGGHGGVHRLFAAVRDDHLAGGHLDAGVLAGVLGHRLAQLGQAGGGGVVVALGIVGGVGGSGDYVGRGGEVGFAGAE